MVTGSTPPHRWDIKPALCLDLDGTIRYSKKAQFINGPEGIVLYTGVEETLWLYRDKGFLIFGVTNQGGVAFGHKTVAGYHREIEATLQLFNRNPFHSIKASFLHPQGQKAPFNHRSLLRKPETGMLALCEAEAFEMGVIIDWEQSVFVGDREEDRLCAQNASIMFIWADEFFNRNSNHHQME